MIFDNERKYIKCTITQDGFDNGGTVTITSHSSGDNKKQNKVDLSSIPWGKLALLELTNVLLVCAVLAGGIYMMSNEMYGGGALVGIALIFVLFGKWGIAAAKDIIGGRNEG